MCNHETQTSDFTESLFSCRPELSTDQRLRNRSVVVKHFAKPPPHDRLLQVVLHSSFDSTQTSDSWESLKATNAVFLPALHVLDGSRPVLFFG